MKTSVKWLIVLVILGIIINIALFSMRSTGNVVKDDTIKIGFVGILSGDASTWGQSALAGATLAVNEFNSKGGIDGRKIELVVEDDRLSSTDSVNAYNKLINVDKVDAIISGGGSGTVAASVPIAQTNNVPVMIATASSPKITQVGNYMFRVMPSDNLQGKFAAEYIFNTLGKRKVALLTVNNDWGIGVMDVFIIRYKEIGGEIVYSNSFGENEKDFKTQFAQIKKTDAELLYFLAYPTNAIAGFKQIKEMDLNIPVICGDAIEDESVFKNEYSDGIYYTISKINSPEEFKGRINSLKGFENLKPNIAAPTGYDATKILLNAISKAGTDKQKLRNELSKTKYYGVSTPVIEFENGDLKEGSMEVKIIKNKESVHYY